MYGVWKESSGEYVTEDDKPIVDPRGNVHTQNETKFKYWAMEQYGITAEEYRGYTFKGTGKTILETAGAYFKVTAPIDAKKGITYLAKKGVTPKNILKAAFGMTDDVVKKEAIEEAVTTENLPQRIIKQENTLKNSNSINERTITDVCYRKNTADPMRNVLGSGRISNPDEWNSILRQLEDSGVEIKFRDGNMAYAPGLRDGNPGQIVIDSDASLSALKHEYQHFLDAQAEGFPSLGKQMFEEPQNRIIKELRAYMVEIKEADKLGLKNVSAQLFENYREEREYIINEFMLLGGN